MGARILKYSVPIDDKPHYIANGPVVHVANQYYYQQSIEVWVLVDKEPTPARKVQVYGTGHPIEKPIAALGSVVLLEGSLVLHVVEIE